MLITLFSIGNAYAIGNIVVVPFNDITNSPEYSWLGVGIAETLSTDLAKIEGITLIERQQLSKILQEISLSQLGLIDDKTAIETGAILGAQHIVSGSYQLLG